MSDYGHGQLDTVQAPDAGVVVTHVLCCRRKPMCASSWSTPTWHSAGFCSKLLHEAPTCSLCDDQNDNVLQEKANVCLIMELAKGGNLHQRIKDPAKPKLCYKEVLQVGPCSYVCTVTAMPKLLYVTWYVARYVTRSCRLAYVHCDSHAKVTACYKVCHKVCCKLQGMLQGPADWHMYTVTATQKLLLSSLRVTSRC